MRITSGSICHHFSCSYLLPAGAFTAVSASCIIKIVVDDTFECLYIYKYRIKFYRCSVSHCTYQNTIRSVRKNFTKLLDRNSSHRRSVSIQESVLVPVIVVLCASRCIRFRVTDWVGLA